MGEIRGMDASRFSAALPRCLCVWGRPSRDGRGGRVRSETTRAIEVTVSLEAIPDDLAGLLEGRLLTRLKDRSGLAMVPKASGGFTLRSSCRT